MPGIGVEMDGATQQAAQCGRQSMPDAIGAIETIEAVATAPSGEWRR
jgi:hypothetical protein